MRHKNIRVMAECAEERNQNGELLNKHSFANDFDNIIKERKKWLSSIYSFSLQTFQIQPFKLFNELISRRQPFSPHKWNHMAMVIINLIIAVILIFSPMAFAEEDLMCQKGVTGFVGATFPRGDILLREGDTLKVYCRLDLKKTKYNASFIKFIFTKANISKDLMSTTVINETTALLQVKNMNVSSPHLSCEIAPPGANPGNYTQVCQNEIDVGYPPKPVENFRCTAPEWRSLNCTWKKPNNPIPTNYALQILTKKLYLAVIPCPNATATPTSCIWGPRTEPFYRQNMNFLHMRINGTNVLVPGGVNWTLEPIDHWSIVVPEAPVDLKLISTLQANVTISWTFKNFKDFNPGLFHDIKICVVNSTDVPCQKMVEKSSKGYESMQLTIPLRYAYVNYSIEVRMRSQKAKDEADYWSNSAIIYVKSMPTSPSNSPTVNVGNYESVAVTKKLRDVYIYWEEIPPLLHNGPDFHYIFSVLEDEEKTNIQPKEITKSYAKFTDLGVMKSYRFQILASNSVGNSSSVSSIYVPKTFKAPGQPTAVSKLDFTNGSLEVSWNPPESTIPIVSYTVFRCTSSKPRPYQCQGLVKWDVVDALKHSQVYSNLLHHNDINYQFAVSANSENMSSGMVWALCTLIHGKVPKKLEKVEKKFENEKEIHIAWQLDCSYKPGVIDGFKITYCRVEKEKRERCIDNEKSEAVSGANITTYDLKKLQPCSTYMIAVSIITASGESQKSDPIFASTKQSAPSNPPETWVGSEDVWNTSALIAIKPSYPLNGIVKEYKITYKPVEGNNIEVVTIQVNSSAKTGSENSTTIDGCFNDVSLPKQTKVQIYNLASNTNYSYRVSVCTVQCSPESETKFFQTDIGYTDMKEFPGVSFDGRNLVITWESPQHKGGPIKYFEILIKQNGKDQDIVSLPYKDDTSSYTHKIEFSCKTDTNSTAQVRAVTELQNGELLYGSWSTPGNYTCGGGTSWLIWAAIVIASILTIFTLVGIGSIKIYKHLKHMREFDVKLPPGLAVQGLDGFTHMQTKRGRKDSEGDTQSFSKELGYPLQIRSIHPSEGSKDFESSTESCLRENETELFSNLGFDNKMYMDEMEKTVSPESSDGNCTIVWDASLPHTSSEKDIFNTLSPVSQNPMTSLPLTVLSDHDDGDNGEKRQSPSLTKPLLDDSQLTEDDSSLPVNYSPVPQLDTSRLLSNGCNNIGIQPLEKIVNNSSRTNNILPLIPSSNHVGAPDVLISSGTRNANGNNQTTVNSFPSTSNSTRPAPIHVNPIPNPSSSSYVKWTQMVPEQFTNGETSIGVDHSRTTTPYCQVGIL